MDNTQYLRSLPEMASYLEGADHVDVKAVQSRADMDHFLAAMLNYRPAWSIFLFRVRAVLAKLMGLQHERGELPVYLPGQVPTTPGEKALSFTVRQWEPGSLWVSWGGDKHLDAYIVVAAQPLDGGMRRFHVGTVVHYRHWTGPVYFNLIRPFHHLLVWAIARAGARG